MIRRGARITIALSAFLAPQGVLAGPPFLTDDPEPTQRGHWEIFGPLVEVEGNGQDYGGAFGVEINYGAADDLQLTLGLPVAFSHDSSGGRWGAGDLEASVKYRFYHNEAAGVQIALFPGVTLPTASNAQGSKHLTALVPVWAQKDAGPWSLFGGGGYAINPGAGNRDYWTAGIAVTRHIGDRFLLGVEAHRRGPDTIGSRSATSLGLGAIYDLPGALRLLASGGPTLEDGGAQGFHTFVALGLDF
jgi:hypothetical protein